MQNLFKQGFLKALMVLVQSSLELELFRKMRDAYLSLRNKKPGDELLCLATVDFDGSNIVFSNEYHKKFVDPRDEFGTFGYDKYATALESAARD